MPCYVPVHDYVLPRHCRLRSKSKQTLYRPAQTLTVPGDGPVVSLMHRPHLLTRKIFLVLISITDRADPSAIVRPEGLGL